MALDDAQHEQSRSKPETAKGWTGNVVTRDGKRILRLFSHTGQAIDLSGDMDARFWKGQAGTESVGEVVDALPARVVSLASALAHLHEVGATSEIHQMISRLRLLLRHDPYAAASDRLLA